MPNLSGKRTEMLTRSVRVTGAVQLGTAYFLFSYRKKDVTYVQ